MTSLHPSAAAQTPAPEQAESRSIYLLHDSERDRDVWVAVEIKDCFYTYDQHTRRFHRRQAVWTDFFTAQETMFLPIDTEAAVAHIRAGVGNYDGRVLRNLVAFRREDTDPLTVARALGIAHNAALRDDR
jgi:hypothetical protein